MREPDSSDVRHEDTIDPFDRAYWQLHDLPDVIRSAETTLTTTADTIGATTFIVQTMRQRDIGDFLFVQRVDKRGTTRIVFPAKVCDIIARQRDAITTRARRKTARDVAAERQRLGLATGFAAMSPADRKAALLKAQRSRREKANRRAARKARKASR